MAAQIGQITFTTSPKMKQKIADAAAAKGMNLSEFCRRIVVGYIMASEPSEEEQSGEF